MIFFYSSFKSTPAIAYICSVVAYDGCANITPGSLDLKLICKNFVRPKISHLAHFSDIVENLRNFRGIDYKTWIFWGLLKIFEPK